MAGLRSPTQSDRTLGSPVNLALNNRPESAGQDAAGVSTSEALTLHPPASDCYLVTDVVRAFQAAIRDAGLSTPEIVPDGRLHRFHVEGDRRSDRNGWYVLFADGLPAGAFGCWKRGVHEKWCIKSGSSLSDAERTEIRRRVEDASRIRQAEEQAQRERTAWRAKRLWDRARPADPRHPYLAAKRVPAHGLRQRGNQLVVPVTIEGDVVGLQFITPDGKKVFLRGTPKRGRYHPLGRPDGRLIVAEGYATAASLHEATGIAVAVAFDAYNLLPVAEALRARFPAAEIVIAGDNDRETEGNPGARRAAAAAKAVGGRVAVPEFGAGEEGTDWNDVARCRGLGAVAAALAPNFRPRAVRVGDVPPDTPVQFAIEGLATAREPVLIFSEDGAGKTTLLLSVLCAMAAEEPVFDRFPVGGGPVLFVSEEDPQGVLANHAEAIGRGHGWDLALIRERFHLLALAGVRVEERYWREVVLDEVRRIGAVAVALDPYADLTNAKENDNDETRPFKSFLREICKLGATPFVCHHAGKAAEGRRNRDRARGASALPAAARSTLFLEETPAGIRVEPLKLSRSVLHPPFVVTREIETDPENPGSWRRARLSFAPADKAEVRSAEAFVVGLLEEHGSLTSTGLKDEARGSGFSGQDVSEALKRLERSGRITFDSGPRNAKNWRLTLPDDPGQGGQLTLPTLPDPAGQGDGGSVHPAS